MSQPAANKDSTVRHPSPRRGRHNYPLLFSDAVGWPLGWMFMSIDVILPTFLSHLTPSLRAVSYIRGIYSLGVWLPSLWAPNLIRTLRRRGPYVVGIGLIERAPLLAVAVATWLWGRTNPALVLGVFFVAWAIRSVAEGVNRPAYSQLVAEGLPPRVRGRFWGYAGAICGALAVPYTLWAAGWLKRTPFPDGYVVLFLIGFAVLAVSLLPIWFVRERVSGRPEPRDSGTNLRSMRLLLADRNFGLMTLAVVVLACADMAAPFYVRQAMDHLGAPEHYAALYAGVQSGAGSIAALLAGLWVSRRGNRPALFAAGLVGALAAFAALAIANPATYTVVFGLLGATSAVVGMYAYNLLLALLAPSRVAVYSGVHYTVVEPARSIMPVIGGEVAQRLGPSAVFLPAACAYLLWCVILLAVREPEHHAR